MNQTGSTGAPAMNAPFSYFGRIIFNALAIGLAESVAILLALFLGSDLRRMLFGGHMFAGWMLYLIAAWIIGAALMRILPGWGLGAVEELRRLVLLLTILFGATIILLFLGKASETASRFVLTAGYFFSLLLVPLARTEMKRLLLSYDRWGIPVAVYTDARIGGRVINALRDEPGLGYMPAGLFSDDPAVGAGQFAGLPVLGTIAQSSSRMPVAVLALADVPPEQMASILDGPLSDYRSVVIVPELHETPSLWVKPRDFVGILGLEISRNLLDPFARGLKRSLELLVVVLTAPLWMTLCVLLALLVWLEDRAGPIFKQERIGKSGRLFYAWKFRTMHPDAERVLREKLATDAELKAEWDHNMKLRNDPRITKVGALLRRMSLDELPQLVNVLRGDMALVGPRPLPRYHHDRLAERVRKLRDQVLPGITGLWQVNCRSESGLEGMEKWDAYYVRNWSVWLDIVIIVRTFRAVVSGRGAF